MKFFIRIKEREPLPKGYGFCWDLNYGKVSVFAPVPFNYILGFLRARLIELSWGYCDRVQRTYEAGFMKGMEVGQKLARHAAMKEVLDGFKEFFVPSNRNASS